jgi:hypothetical protein
MNPMEDVSYFRLMTKAEAASVTVFFNNSKTMANGSLTSQFDRHTALDSVPHYANKK